MKLNPTRVSGNFLEYAQMIQSPELISFCDDMVTFNHQGFLRDTMFHPQFKIKGIVWKLCKR